MQKKINDLHANIRTISSWFMGNFITFEMVSFSSFTEKQFVFLRSAERWLWVSHSDVTLRRFSYFVLTTLLWSACYYYHSFMHKNIEHSSVTLPWLCAMSPLNSPDSEQDSELWSPEVPFHCTLVKKSVFSLILQDEITKVLFWFGLVSYAFFFPKKN